MAQGAVDFRRQREAFAPLAPEFGARVITVQERFLLSQRLADGFRTQVPTTSVAVRLGKTKQGISQSLATFESFYIVTGELLGPITGQPKISKRLLILAQ